MSDPNQPADDPFAPPPEGGSTGIPGIPGDVPPPPPAYGAYPPAYGTPPPPPGYGAAVPPAYGAPQVYGAPAPYGYAAPKSSGRAVAVMVLGIVGLVFTCFYGIGIIPAIVALALAPSAKREINGSQGALTGLGMVKAGTVCAWIAVGIALVFVVIIIIAAVGGAFSSSSSRL